MITELKLCFAEYGTKFTNMYGDIDERYYNAISKVFHDVIEIVAKDRELFLVVFNSPLQNERETG